MWAVAGLCLVRSANAQSSSDACHVYLANQSTEAAEALRKVAFEGDALLLWSND
jgi:hypothetical protein